MQDNKEDGGASGTPLTPEEEHKIEIKVDRMLDPKGPAEPAAKSGSKKSAKTPPPINIFTDPQTAPEVPEDVIKTMVEPDQAEMAEKPGKVLQLADDPATKPADEPADDAATETAVESITKQDSDEILAAEDAEIAKAFTADKPKGKGRIRRFFARWWGSKKARYTTLGVVIVLLVAAAIWPVSRAFALNLVGVRTSASLTVLDGTTQLPLKNVTVRLGGAHAVSDQDGFVTLSHVRLGSQTLQVQKTAFATLDRKVQLGLGTNSLGDVALRAVGAQYTFNVTDYVSGKPVPGAQASSGSANARASKKGVIVLTVTDPHTATLQVNVTADTYQKAKVTVNVDSTAPTNVQLVPAHQEVYISKQSGKYDLYRSGVDGNNKKLLLAASGYENSQLALVASPDGNAVALVSTRDNVRDSGGYLLQALTLVNISSGSAITIDHSERIQLVGWMGDHLVYAMAKAGASAANPSRYQLMAYDYSTKQRLLLDHANYFNDVVSADGVIYYATSNQYAGGVSQFNRINPDGSGKQTLLTNEVWNIFRKDYDDFVLSTSTNWYNFTLGDTKPQAGAAAYEGTGRVYLDSPDGKHSAWVDNRDGKGTLIIYDQETGKETTLLQQSGLNNPVRWLNNTTLIYRVSTSQQTADYVVSLSGTAGKKITDVTNTSGAGLWYFY